MRTLFGLSFFLVVSSASAQNFVANGDFTLGNTGFSTDYAYQAPATNALAAESVYTVVANTVNPFVLNNLGEGIVDYNDYTTGSGLFMAVNGSTTLNSLVWGQTLNGLTVGGRYRFEMWVSRWTPSDEAPARLQVNVGGTVIGNFSDPNTAGVWEGRTALFTATSTSMSLQIRSLEVALRGNDFGLDGIGVRAVPEPATFVALGLGLLATARRRKLGSKGPVLDDRT